MDFGLIAVMAVFGAICGGVGAIPAVMMKDKKKGQLVSIAIFVLLFTLGKGPVREMYLKQKDPLAHAVKGKYSDEFDEIMKHPRYQEMIKEKTPAEVKMISQALSQKGLKRLSHETLLSWNTIRLELANSDKAMCAGLWTGQLEVLPLT